MFRLFAALSKHNFGLEPILSQAPKEVKINKVIIFYHLFKQAGQSKWK